MKEHSLDQHEEVVRCLAERRVEPDLPLPSTPSMAINCRSLSSASISVASERKTPFRVSVEGFLSIWPVLFRLGVGQHVYAAHEAILPDADQGRNGLPAMLPKTGHCRNPVTAAPPWVDYQTQQKALVSL